MPRRGQRGATFRFVGDGLPAVLALGIVAPAVAVFGAVIVVRRLVFRLGARLVRFVSRRFPALSRALDEAAGVKPSLEEAIAGKPPVSERD